MSPRQAQILSVALLALAALCALPAIAPAAELPPVLWQAPEDNKAGEGAGRIDLPRGIAASPATGHVYVADRLNERIDEFSSWGVFVRAFGWGVADGKSEFETCTATCLKGIEGAGGGQSAEPQGVAADSVGDVYVADRANHRIQKFSSTGQFLLAIGGDVIASGPDNSSNDEEQEITLAASSGAFKLSFEDPFGAGITPQTSSLPFNATAAQVQTALDALTTISSHGGSVTVSGGPGDPTGQTPYTVRFEGGLSGDDVPRLKIDRSALGPATIGARLTCSTETDATSISYQWLRNGEPIGGATSLTYTTAAADEGKAIQCQVFAINSNTGSTQVANPVYVAPPAPGEAPPVAPNNISQPGGFPRVGAPSETLTCNGTGGWTGATSFSYRWYRDGVLIPGANASSYTASPADLASPAAFQCAAIAANAGGSAAKVSFVTNTVPRPLPNAPGRVEGFEGAEASMEPVRTLDNGGGPEVCKAAAGDVCKAGDTGGAHGQFRPWAFGNFIAAGPGDVLYVGDGGRIQLFEASGAFKEEVDLPEKGEIASLAVDPGSGDIYYDNPQRTFNDEHSEYPDVHKLSPGGAALGIFKVDTPGALAVDAAGNVYVVEERHPGHLGEILEFGPGGKQIASFDSTNQLFRGGLATNVIGPGSKTPGDLYVSTAFNTGGAESESFLTAYGPPEEFELPPKVAPEIKDQYAASVDPEGALLRAKVNPHFWKDTTYYVEYGADRCSEGGCASVQPAPPGSTLTARLTSVPQLSAGVVLTGLSPHTTYHYRFVAQSAGSEGQPVHGVGGTPAVDGEEATFTTQSPLEPNANCPNSQFRSGASTFLPDCRAYEMVSPLDKNNGDIVTLLAGSLDFKARLDQSAQSGEALAFSSYRAFGGSGGAGWSSQYLARRGVDSWSTEAISPPKGGRVLPGGNGATQLDTQFKAFSPDLQNAWITDSFGPALDPAVPGTFVNIFRRDNTSGAYEAQIRAAPPHFEVGDLNHYPELQGVSDDGAHAVFTMSDNLTPDAPELGLEGGPGSLHGFNQLYDSYGEGGEAPQLRLASVLPNGKAAETGASAGVHNENTGLGRMDSVAHAVSADGSRIYWTAANVGPGKLYVRVDGAETLPVSEATSPPDTSPARFWTASTDGQRALYTYTAGAKKGDLYEFDLEKGKSKRVAHKAIGVLGASEDLSRFYFLSEEALAEGATAGKPNLYLDEEGAFAYIGPLSAEDAQAIELDKDSPGSVRPFYHTARASADGAALAFMSDSRELSEAAAGYDNTDQQSGKPDEEVYRYDAVSSRLACVSCNPSGARPAGGRLLAQQVSAVALLPTFENELYQPRYLSDDGSRLFFDSFEALLPRDTDGSEDVYQWEAPGSGDCTEESASFAASSGGCLGLISSGDSKRDSEFIDASQSGRDVFFTTLSSLLPQDSGLVDVYDARAEGGFPAPPSPPPPCEGEACQGSPSLPNDATPASASYEGLGNEPGKPKGRCAKGKARHKGRCVAKKHKQAKRKANRNRRAAR